MKHSKKFMDAMWVIENPKDYDSRMVIDANRYVNDYLEGYNQCLKRFSQKAVISEVIVNSPLIK